MNNVQTNQRNDHHLISPTAKLVAHFRRYTDIPYAEFIADEIGARKASIDLLKGEDKLDKVAWLAMMFEVRYKGLNAHIRNTGYENILEIASGVGQRALEMSADPRILYVSTDLDGMVTEQRELIGKILAGAKRPNLHFLETDALKLEDMTRAASYFGGEPFAIINEGLLPYFPREEKAVLADNIRKVLPKGGAWITPDVITKDRMEAILNKDPDLLELLALIAGVTKRSMIDNAFDNDEDALSFFTNLGYEVERCPSVDGSYEISSLSRVKVPQPMIDRNKTRETWVMRTK